MKRRSRELSSHMAAKILKHERAEKFDFQNLLVKIRSLFFNSIKSIGFYCLIVRYCMSQNAGYFNKGKINAILFLFSFKKIASRIYKQV